jgi:hypothetical protein
MSLIEMLPDSLKRQIRNMPDPDEFIVQALEKAVAAHKHRQKVVSVRGKYRNIKTSSEDFALRKQQEIELEG